MTAGGADSPGRTPLSPRASARAGAWALGADGVGQLLRLAASLFVASRLGPSDFAAWTLLSVFIAAAVAIDDGGLHQSLVVRGRWTDEEASATFWTSVALGAAVACGAVAAGSLLSSGGTSLVPHLAVFSITLLSSAAAVVPRAHLTRAMDFRRISICEVASRVAGAVVTVVAAAWTGSIWSLLLGVVVQRAAEHLSLASVAWSAPRARPHFAAFGPMARFSIAAIGTSLLGFGSAQAAAVVVAATLSASALGVWGLANTVLIVAQTRVAAVLAKVALPTFVALPPSQRAGAYVRAVRVTSSALTAASILVALLMPFVVDIWLGERWRDLVVVAALLVPAGIARGIGPLTSAYFFAENRADLNLRWELVRLPLTAGLTLIGAWTWGLAGVAAMAGPLLLAGVTVRMWFFRRHFDLDAIAWARAATASLVPATTGTIVAVALMSALGTTSVLSATLTLAGFMAVYTATTVVAQPLTRQQWLAVLRRERHDISADPNEPRAA